MKLPNKIVEVTGTGSSKYDKIVADALMLNSSPKFREAAKRLANRVIAKRMNEILYGVKKP